MKKMVSLLLLAFIVQAFVPFAYAASATDFTDVPSGAWYYSDLEYVVRNGIITGTSATTFGPNDSTTRGQFITLLGRHYKSQTKAVNTGKFIDVGANEYYTEHVYWAVDWGIASGTSDNTFEPNLFITREQAATMVYRYAMNTGIAETITPENSNPVQFNDDTKIAGYAAEAVRYLQTIDVIGGDNYGNFNPKNNISRAEVAAIMARFIRIFNKYNGGENIEFPEPLPPLAESPVENTDWKSNEYVLHMNLEAARLINEVRVAEGESPITYNQEYQYGVDIRAGDLAELFSHTRPDGSAFNSVYKNNQIHYANVFGECIAAGFMPSFPSSGAAAKKCVDLWMNSPGHRSILLSSRAVEFACGISINPETNTAYFAYVPITNRHV